MEISTLFSQYLTEQIGCRSLGRRNYTIALVCVHREQALRIESDTQGTYCEKKICEGKRDAAGEGRKNCQITMQAMTLKEERPGSSQEEVCHGMSTVVASGVSIHHPSPWRERSQVTTKPHTEFKDINRLPWRCRGQGSACQGRGHKA